MAMTYGNNYVGIPGGDLRRILQQLSAKVDVAVTEIQSVSTRLTRLEGGTSVSSMNTSSLSSTSQPLTSTPATTGTGEQALDRPIAETVPATTLKELTRLNQRLLYDPVYKKNMVRICANCSTCRL